jgi:hypothetical protein
MGFPEPGVTVTCSSENSDDQGARFEFVSLGWGDNVTFKFSPEKIEIVQQSTWSPANAVTQVVSWNQR